MGAPANPIKINKPVLSQGGSSNELDSPSHNSLITSKTFPQRVWDWLGCFRSIQLAIVLISLLAVGVLVGVFMPQEGLVKPVEIKQTYGENYRLLKAFGLFNVYSSYWFITLEVLFFFNLLFGSFKWLKKAYFSATRQTYCAPEHIEAAKEHGVLMSPEDFSPSVGQLKSTLKKFRYGVYQDPAYPNRLYATKGNFSRLGPVVAHFGILLMLIFSVYGVFTGFKAQKLAVPGETFSIMQSEYFMPNITPAFWQGEVPTQKIHIQDFKINFYKDHPETVQQYYCTLDIVNPDGSIAAHKTISVNDPINWKDLTIYQASYAPTGKLFVELDGRPFPVKVNSEFNGRPISITPLTKNISLVAFPFFVQQDPQAKENHVRFFLQKDGQFLGGAPGKMPTNLRLREGESGTLANIPIKFVKPEMATGLQIKKAPEVVGMYLSYIIIILGTVMCFFSQRQIWIGLRPSPSGKGQEVFFLYKTNKARISFLKELQALDTTLRSKWKSPPSAPQDIHPNAGNVLEKNSPHQSETPEVTIQ
ncbi:MAG: cytochrome c biogenesis protein ResB [Cyanobacteria bacterium]|nr:cytochrome c biogenesis protein ResB [Cyanobacteriota bacterium]